MAGSSGFLQPVQHTPSIHARQIRFQNDGRGQIVMQLNNKIESLLLGYGLKIALHDFGQITQDNRLQMQLHFPGFNLGKVQNFIDQD